VEAVARHAWVDPEVWVAAARRFPVRIPRRWFELIDGGPTDPLALQALPSAGELEDAPGDRVDPVGELALCPVPWVVQKHADRCLLLLTKRCHLMCRYCFRRDHSPSSAEDPTEEELARAVAWCLASGVEEVILSGGDPLAVRDERLLGVLDALHAAVPVVRIHTRAPITAPDRITPMLVSGLARRRPLWVVVHANHPRELDSGSERALRALVQAGLPVLNQSVLLRGVNDDAAVLAELSRALVRLGVKPYYLHHTDAARGNAHLRVSPHRGLAIHRALSRQVSGLALPTYVVDLPDGSGKVRVADAVATGRLASEPR